MTKHPIELEVNQVNCFYNYTAGLEAMEVDLLKTAVKLLKSGLARTVCFSDFKSAYLDTKGAVQVEWIQPQGRQWDTSWVGKFGAGLPPHVTEDLIFCLELSFHEFRIQGTGAKHMPPYLRAPLPPLVLERDGDILPIRPWLKLYADGIFTLSYQLDAKWEGLDEPAFIEDVVNFYQRYFDRIWVQAHIQRLESEQVLPKAFEDELSLGGQRLGGRLVRRLLKEMRGGNRRVLDESLGKNGKTFEIGGESWELHPIAGSEDQENWEATFELCRSLYANAVASTVVPHKKKRHQSFPRVTLWQGRPSISLLRFNGQPDTKNELIERFSPSISRVLMRSPTLSGPPRLPPDLRVFNDYCFHGNRALLLWTWLRPSHAPDDAWADTCTRMHVLENQARSEHLEYHNFRVARACAITAAPPTDDHLMAAYEILASAETVVHHASQFGEVTDALEYMFDVTGTSRVISVGKEQARWYLDERRYQVEKDRSRLDRWLTVMLGFVGTAALANLVTLPMLRNLYPGLGDVQAGLAALFLASGAVVVLAIAISMRNRWRQA